MNGIVWGDGRDEGQGPVNGIVWGDGRDEGQGPVSGTVLGMRQMRIHDGRVLFGLT